MKYYISYFYKIRYFKRNMIPFSTALYDPKWYHGNHYSYDNTHLYIDSNGVLNGGRCDELCPPRQCSGICSNDCKDSPDNCEFIKTYYDHLCTLDFKSITNDLETKANLAKEYLGFNEDPIIVIIVYEAPDNKCSERSSLVKWFNDNGIKLDEFNE